MRSPIRIASSTSWVTKITVLRDLAMQAAELRLQAKARDRVERAERLVHQQHRRVGRERACEPDPLALAAGELRRDSASRRRPRARRARAARPCGPRSATSPSRAAAARWRCSRRPSCAGRGRPAGSRSRSRAAARSTGRSRTLRPSMRMSPESKGISRLTIFSAVVLPPPDGPDEHAERPGRDLEREVGERRRVAPGVALRDVVEDDLGGGAHRHGFLIPATPTTPPATHERRGDPHREAVAGDVEPVARPCDRGADDGDPEQAGDARDGVVDAARDAGVVLADVGEHRRGERRDDHREPDREDEQRRAGAPSSTRSPASGARCRAAPARDERPDAHEPARAVAHRQAPDARREQEHHDGDREEGEAASQGACTPPAAAGTARGRTSGSRARRRRSAVSRFANEKLRRRKRRSGSIGCGARLSQSTNSANSDDAADERRRGSTGRRSRAAAPR